MANHRYIVIANPIAGRGRGATAEAIVRQALDAAKDIECTVTYTEAPGHAVMLAQGAVSAGYDVVVAAGGDGTVNEVITGLVTARSGMPATSGPSPSLGVLPLGTGNDYAWALGIPTHDPRAARLLLDGKGKPVDLGQVTDERGHTWYFQNHLGAGLVAATAKESEKIKRLRGLALYMAALFRVIPRYRHGPEVRASYNGITRTEPMLLLGASIGPRTAGGFLIAPDALVDDGLLDVVFAHSPNIPTTLWLLPQFLRGTHVKRARYVTVDRTAGLVAEIHEGIPVHVDGQVIRTDARRLEIGVLPGWLRVICPRARDVVTAEPPCKWSQMAKR